MVDDREKICVFFSEERQEKIIHGSIFISLMSPFSPRCRLRTYYFRTPADFSRLQPRLVSDQPEKPTIQQASAE